MRTRVAAVVQARVGSTRLPGKVLRPLGGRPVLDWVVEAAALASGVDDVVVATTTLAIDDAVCERAHELGVPVHRGPEDDVLTRYVGAAAAAGCDAVVRLTADCPLVDPALIDAVVSLWRTVRCDYVSTVTPRTLPRGLDVELISRAALVRVDARAGAHHRAHVTSLVYSEPDAFDILGIIVTPAADDLRVTLDTADDARLLDALVDRLGAGPHPWQRVVAELRADPALAAVNAHVEQKALVDG